jgi:O-antigen ligase
LNASSQSVTVTAPEQEPKALRNAFFWLSGFYFVYCARPEDWIPGLRYFPVAKITGICALMGLIMAAGKSKRKFKDLPKEAGYLLAIICLLFVSGLFSPVWKTGAIMHTIDFAKLYIAWILTFLLISRFEQLRQIIFVQSACVPMICIVSIIKGHSRPRLEGVLGGIYSNSNDLAFAIVLSIPFCAAFFLLTKNIFGKMIWLGALVAMLAALFMTASRAGFVTLVISGVVCLWHFGVKGKRLYLIVGTLVIGSLLMATAGKNLQQRFEALSGEQENYLGAYGSYLSRMFLMKVAAEAIGHYPLFGLGAHNFVPYAGTYYGQWQPVHMSYLQIGAEGGIPVLILYLMFFQRGFSNLRKLRKMKNLDPEAKLFVGALHSSLIGFLVGANFAPEAYQFFPYFGVVYTSVLLAVVRDRNAAVPEAPKLVVRNWRDPEPARKTDVGSLLPTH